jgi:hypothetical protein
MQSAQDLNSRDGLLRQPLSAPSLLHLPANTNMRGVAADNLVLGENDLLAVWVAFDV